MDLKNHIEYALFRGLTGLLHRLPPERAREWLGGAGVAAGSLLRIRRGVVDRQLAMVFPGMAVAERSALARRMYRHLGRTAGEVFAAPGAMRPEDVRIDPGFEELDRALDAGRGAIVATGHIGNFELGGAVLARRYDLLDVVKRQRNPLFDSHLERLRSERGIRTVSAGRAAAAVVAQLRSGGLVSLLIDQDAGPGGVRTGFLDHPASTWPGAARFSLSTGCPVVPMAMRREQSGRHVLLIGKSLWPDGEADVVAYTARISRAVEEYIRQTPEQWFWVHRRWKGAVAKERA